MQTTSESLGNHCAIARRGCRVAALVAVAGVASCAVGQITQEPIGAILRYQVATNGGAWGSNVVIGPGDRVEWRAVLTFTGTANAEALGRIYYQPVISNVDNTGTGDQIDRLGEWRNGGVSGQGNTTLAQGMLSAAEGNNSGPLASYGRVTYGFTSRSTTAGSSGALVGHRHSSDGGSPPGSFIRIAGSNNPTWYPPTIPVGSVPLNNQILWGVVSDNNVPTNTWFASGTQDIVIFRQAFIASTDPVRQGGGIVTINSEAATLQRASGAVEGDLRFMTWAQPGEGGATATIRCGVQYEGATISLYIPSPGAIGLVGLGCAMVLRRRARR